MEDINISQSPQGERIDLSMIIEYLLSCWKYVASSIAFFLVVSFILYLYTPPVYEISMTLSASPAGSTMNNMSSGGGLAGVSRLIGFGGGGDATSEYTKFQSLIASNELAERLSKRGLLQLMFPKKWDAKSNKWKQPSSILATLGLKTSEPPGASDVMKVLEFGVTSDLSLKTSILTISTKSRDRNYGITLLTMIYHNANAILRERARALSSQRIKYLNEMLVQVHAIEQRQALILLLNQEVQKQMAISSDPNYAADVIDPPHASPVPVSPKLIINVAVAVLLGGIIGLAAHAMSKMKFAQRIFENFPRF